jgi:hypothetical protein
LARPYLKNKSKKVWGIVLVADQCVPNKSTALSSNSSTIKKQKVCIFNFERKFSNGEALKYLCSAEIFQCPSLKTGEFKLNH